MAKKRHIHDSLNAARQVVTGFTSVAQKYRRILQYVIPIVLVILLVVARLTLFDSIAQTPFLYFFVVVIISALYGDFFSGLFTTVMSGLVSNFYFIGQPGINAAPTAILGTVVFIVEGCLLVYLIDNRRNFVKRLEGSNRKVTHILESISDSFISFDKNWIITYCNPQIEKYFGRNEADLLGKNVWDEYPKRVSKMFYKKCHYSLKTMKPTYFEMYSPMLNKWYEFRTFPSVDGLNVYISDVSERKNLDTMKDSFISTASHELKTPVTVIKLYCQLLQKRLVKLKDEKNLYIFSKIESSVDMLVALITELLDVSRLENGKLKLNKRQFSIDTLVKRKIIDFQFINDSHVIEKNGTTGAVIDGDEERLGQVLINLLNNAMKYSQAGTKIIVGTKEENNRVIVSVQDFGMGIRKEQLNKVFERFYRVKSASDSNIDGTGLGLYISSGIIKRHKGKIWAESTKGKGSTFYFSLPVIRA